MKVHRRSRGASLLVGIVYSLLNVRSPAPPAFALVNLLGLLVGEQIIPLAIKIWSKEPENSVGCRGSGRQVEPDRQALALRAWNVEKLGPHGHRYG